MPNVYVITGGPKVGKTFIAKHLGAFLSDDKLKVAIIDATNNCDLYHSFYTEEKVIDSIEDAKGDKITALAYANIDIFTRNPFASNTHSPEEIFQVISKIKNKYDVVLVDADIFNAADIVKNSKLILIQDPERKNALIVQKFLLLKLAEVQEKMPETILIINKAVNARIKIEEIEQYFMFKEEKGKVIRLLVDSIKEDYMIPFWTDNFIQDLNNKYDGIVETGLLTKDLKAALSSLTKLIVSSSKKENKEEPQGLLSKLWNRDR